jgi:hypothetical protein
MLARCPRPSLIVFGREAWNLAMGRFGFIGGEARVDRCLELCSFDAFLKRYQLDDPPLSHLAVIVRGADTSRLELAPQSAGLYAISLGLSATITNDHAMLRHGLVMYDALYAWCAKLQNETHPWPPAGYSLAARLAKQG